MSAQRGNILFLILLAVVLFAALSYAVTQGTRGGGNNAAAEKMQSAASEWIQYATLLQNTINRLMLTNDCKDTDISFENNTVTTYVNASAPARCKLFDPAGGGLPFKTIPSDWLNTSYAGSYDYGYFGVYDQTSITNLGTNPISSGSVGAGIDLVMLIPYLNDNFCLAINKMAGVNIIPAPVIKIADINDSRHFKGYYWNLNAGYGFGGLVLPNYGCMNVAVGNGATVYSNVAYFALLAR